MIRRKDFFGLKDMSADDIRYVLTTAETMKYILNHKSKKVPHLQGKSVVLLFYMASAREKLSYEMAGQHLGATVVDMTREKFGNEKLKDMGQLIDQMGADFIILRHPMAGSASFLAENVNASVINAGDGYNENPAQSLLDLLTIKENKRSFQGLKVSIIGDILHSRVSRSNIWALTKLGADVRVAGPPTLMAPELENFGAKAYFNAKEAVKDADVIITTKMRVEEHEKNTMPSFDEYKNLFRIDENLLKYAKNDVIIMHPGPIMKDIEISTKIIESKQCIINDHIANGVAVRMAVLYILSQVGGGIIG